MDHSRKSQARSPKDSSAEAPLADPAKSSGSFDAYHNVAETVGLLPSVRLKDNLFQGIFVACGCLIGTVIGFVMGRGPGALIGFLGGLVISGFASGLVLMVLGWVRVIRRK